MLTVNGVTKYYEGRNGIGNIGFSCQDGEAAAVIGPNGAGKSTLLKIMAGALRADEGSVLIDGTDVQAPESRGRIGYMPDEAQLARGLTVKKFLTMVCDYKYGGGFKDEMGEAVSAFGLEEYLDRDFGKLSMGNRKKTMMVAAFLGNPRLVILDEPTNGIDTSGIIALKQAIRRARDMGGIVIVSSHILDFAGGISDVGIFLKDGGIAAVERDGRSLEERYRRLYAR